MREAWISMSVAMALLVGCSKHAPAPPPHALEDASTAAQRASAAMKPSSNLTTEKNAAAKPTDGGVQAEKPAKTQ